MNQATSRPRMGVYLSEYWLPAVRPTVRATTYYSYAGIVRSHLRPRFGDWHLDAITPQELNGFYGDLLTSGHTRRSGGLAPSSVIRIHAAVHRSLRDAVRWGYLEANPADGADPPKHKARAWDLGTWDAHELRRFLEFTSHQHDSTYWLLLAMTGMRRGEVLGLRWRDVDLTGGVVAVRQTVVAVGGKRELSAPKTVRGRRLVALDRGTIAALEASWPASIDDPSALIFAEADGRPLSGPAMTKRFNALVRRTGLPAIRLHDLRHTHATLALRAGVHPKIVSERLGHSTVAFTLDVYSHATPHMQSEAAQCIGDLINGL